MNRKTAEFVAHWWADKLRAPQIMDNNARDIHNAFAMALAEMINKDRLLERDQTKVDAFEGKLSKELEKVTIRYMYFIGVDYNADKIIDDCASAVGLELIMCDLPFKTDLRVYEDEHIEHNGKVIFSL